MTLRALSVAILLVVVWMGGGETAADGDSSVRGLIQQLGSDDYTLRRRAADQLQRQGAEAEIALRSGLRHVDPHVRRTCRELLLPILMGQYRRELEAFRAAGDVADSAKLPAWQRYRQQIGQSPQNRQLYLRLLTHESLLLDALDHSPAAAESVFTDRLNAVAQKLRSTRSRNELPFETVAALLFAASQAELHANANITSNPLWTSLIGLQQFNAALTSGEDAHTLQKLVGQWFLTPVTDRLVVRKLLLANRYTIAEGVPLARYVLDHQEKMGAQYLPAAIQSLAMIGGEPYAALLAAQLDNTQQCGFRSVRRQGNTQRIPIQVRDVALAWLVMLTEQDFDEYHMPDAELAISRVLVRRSASISIAYLGFNDDELRQQALRKWQQWVRDHPLPQAPPLDLASARLKILPANAPAVAAVSKQGPDRPNVIGLELAERQVRLQLGKVESLIRDQQFVEAAQLLGNLLRQSTQLAFQPDPQVPLFQNLRDEAERLLDQFPNAAFDAFQLQFGTAAQQELDRATRTQDLPAIAEIAQRSFHTEAGSRAAMLHAIHLMDHGQFHDAALRLERLRNHSRLADRYEPVLTVRLILALYLSGQIEEAQVWLDSASERELDIEQLGLALPTTLNEIARAFSLPLEMTGDDNSWLLARGNAASARIAEVQMPFLSGQPRIPISPATSLRNALAKQQRESFERFNPRLVRIIPLAVGDQLIAREAHAVTCVDSHGQLRWRLPHEQTWASQETVGTPQDSASPPVSAAGGLAEEEEQAIRERVFESTAYGEISSDGRHVFLIEGFRMGDAAASRRYVDPQGNLRLDLSHIRLTNQLTAISVETGKVVWSLGDRAGDDPTGADVWFGHAPLPYAGNLYLVGVRDDQALLFQVNPETGAIRRTVALGLNAFSTGALRQNLAFPALASDDSRLVVQLPNDTIVALDLLSETIRWVRQSKASTESTGKPAAAGVQIQIRLAAGQAQVQTSSGTSSAWWRRGPMIQQGRLIVPRDSQQDLVCLDLATGAELWTAPRRGGLYVGGCSREQVVIVESDSVRCLNAATGEQSWGATLHAEEEGQTSGLGLMTDSQFLLPTTKGRILAYDLGTGNLVAQIRSQQSGLTGNLIARNSRTFSATAEGVFAFDSLSSRLAAIRNHPIAELDPKALQEAAQVYLDSNEFDKALELARKFQASAAQTAEAARLTLLVTVAGLREDYDKFRGQLPGLTHLDTADPQVLYLLEQVIRADLQHEHPHAATELAFDLMDRIAPELSDKWILLGGQSYQATSWARFAGVLADIWELGGAEIRTEYTARLSRLRQLHGLDAVLQLAPAHPLTASLRIQAALESLGKDQARAAEALLEDAMLESPPPERLEAARELIRLWASQNRGDEADALLKYLARQQQLQEGVVLEASLQVPEAVRVYRERAHWPARLPTLQSAPAPSARLSSVLTRVTARSDAPWSIRRYLTMDSRNRKVIQHDAFGGEVGRLSFSNINFASQAALTGRLILVATGNRLTAFDRYDSTSPVVWNQTISDPRRQDSAANRINVVVAANLRASGSSPRMLRTGQSTVAYLAQGLLVVFDAQSGRPRWKRVVPEASGHFSIFGDRVMVANQDDSPLQAFRLCDGQRLPELAIPRDSRVVCMTPRFAVVSKMVAKQRSFIRLQLDGSRLDSLGTAAPDAGYCVHEEQTLATLDPAGRLELWNIEAAERQVALKLDARPQVQSLWVYPNGSNWLIAPNTLQGAVLWQMQIMGSLPINEQLYCVDPERGELKWQLAGNSMALNTLGSPNLPVLVFQKTSRAADRKSRADLKICDSRTGEVIFDQQVERQTRDCGVVADLNAKTLELRTAGRIVQLRYPPAP